MEDGNFSLAIFKGYFGADPARSHRVVLHRIRPDGTIADTEFRPTVAVKSHNFRIELDAAAGLAYPPGNARPIAAFVRSATRQFRYMLLMPADANYPRIEGVLTATAGPRPANRMRRGSRGRCRS